MIAPGLQRAGEVDRPVSTSSAGGLIASIAFGFLPAFRDTETGETHLSVNEDGSISPRHLIDRVPEHWVSESDELGRTVALKEGIIAGFVRHGRFYGHAELLQYPPLDA